jgi:Uma2 family endonuclease
LAVEVVSPSESAGDLNKKVNLMLRAGSLAVWVIYPEERTVQVYRPDGTSYTPDKLSAPELLADWEAPVSSLFED